MKNHFYHAFLICVTFLFTGNLATAQFDLLHHQPNVSLSPWGIADDGQGNTYLAGRFQTSLTLGTFTLTTTNTTGFIGKYNSTSATWLWVKKITLSPNSGSATFSDVVSLAIDNAGNAYITGAYSGTISFDNISISSTKQGNQFTTDIHIAKVNSNGEFIWVKSLGSKTGMDFGNAITLDGSNNVFITGAFTSKIVNCDYAWGTNLFDIYLAKLNNSGTLQWEKKYKSNNVGCYSNQNYGQHLAADVSGNVFITGTYTGSMSFGTGAALTVTSLGGTDVFAAKINGSGITQWVRSAGTTFNDDGRAVHVDVSGNVYAGGKLNSNSFLSKFNSSGVPQWSVNPFPVSVGFPSTSVRKINAYQNSILITDTGIGFKTVSPADGTVLSSDSLVGNNYGINPNGTGTLTIFDVKAAGAGYVFSALGRCGSVTLANLALTSTNPCPSSNSHDLFMVRTSSVPPPPLPPVINAGGIQSPDLMADEEFVVYPNPATDQIHITFKQLASSHQLTIHNQLGQQVWSEILMEGSQTAAIQLDNKRFENGVYYITVISGGNHYTRRLLIQHQ